MFIFLYYKSNGVKLSVLKDDYYTGYCYKIVKEQGCLSTSVQDIATDYGINRLCYL